MSVLSFNSLKCRIHILQIYNFYSIIIKYNPQYSFTNCRLPTLNFLAGFSFTEMPIPYTPNRYLPLKRLDTTS